MKKGIQSKISARTQAVRISAAVIAAIVCGVFLLQLNAGRAEIQKLEENKVLEIYRESLASEFDRALISVKVLSVLAEDKELSDKRFQRLASQLFNQLSGVLSLQLSPDAIVTYLYPNDISSGIKGRNLLNDPITSTVSHQTINTKTLMIDGPRPLQQGGHGIIARLPIFQNGEFWGFATAVFRLDELFNRVGLENLKSLGFEYDIWIESPPGQLIAIFNRGLKLHDKNIRTSHVAIANQNWILGLKSSDRLPLSQISALELAVSFLIILLASSLTATTYQLYNHRNHLNQLVKDKTSIIKEREIHLSQAQRVAKLGSWNMKLGAKQRTLSPQAMQILKSTSTSQNLKDFSRTVSPSDQKEFDLFISSSSGANRNIEYNLPRPDQDTWIKEVVEFDTNKKEFIGTIQDITTEKENQALIWKHANIDPLTKLPNIHRSKDLLQSHISQLNESDDALLIILFDIHHFRIINDSFGEKAGDKLLIATADRIFKAFPEALFIGRFAADVFLMVLKRRQGNLETDKISSTLENHFDHPITLQEATRFLSFNIGISCWPVDSKKPDDLLRYANIALHSAKRKNDKVKSCLYSTQLLEEFKAQDELDIDLRAAIQEKQIFMVYQPVIRTDTLKISGMEALVRWKHPTKGLIRPDIFISRAEQNGQIFSLGKAIIHLVSNDSRIFANAGMNFIRININISRSQLSDDGFSEFLTDQLRNSFPKDQPITLEVTESFELTDYDTLKSIISNVKHDNLEWSLDDFGTGYSSYSAIGQLPIDNIKIDRSFISNLESRKVDQAIVENIINMAHTLNKTVTAEGVENEKQVEILQSMRCDYLQGYYFSKPITPNDLIDTYQSNL